MLDQVILDVALAGSDSKIVVRIAGLDPEPLTQLGFESLGVAGNDHLRDGRPTACDTTWLGRPAEPNIMAEVEPKAVVALSDTARMEAACDIVLGHQNPIVAVSEAGRVHEIELVGELLSNRQPRTRVCFIRDQVGFDANLAEPGGLLETATEPRSNPASHIRQDLLTRDLEFLASHLVQGSTGDEHGHDVWLGQRRIGGQRRLRFARNALDRDRDVVVASGCIQQQIDRRLNPLLVDEGDHATLGLESPLPPYLAVALGAAEATLSEMTSAFAVFPNQGVRMRPYSIQKVNDREGNVLEENKPEPRDAIRADTAFVMTNLLRGVVQRGTAIKAAALNWPIGGKTGTTDDYTDAWFIGFDPDITIGVWVGLDQKKPIGHNQTGAEAALPIWIEIMKAWIGDRSEPPKFDPPGNIVFVSVDKSSGGAADETTPGAISEAFIAGTEPGGFRQ